MRMQATMGTYVLYEQVFSCQGKTKEKQLRSGSHVQWSYPTERTVMAVLIRHRAEGMTEAQYDEISPPLIEKLKTQPGFLFHTAFTDNGQFTVSEIWENQEQHDTWFDANVAPNLPMAVQQEVVPLHTVYTP